MHINNWIFVLFIEYLQNVSVDRTYTQHWFKITLPNTDQAHDKHQWTTTNFSQVQLYNPWWWIAYDTKHVGVIFNFMSFKFLHNVDFDLCLYNRVHYSDNKRDWQ